MVPVFYDAYITVIGGGFLLVTSIVVFHTNCFITFSYYRSALYWGGSFCYYREFQTNAAAESWFFCFILKSFLFFYLNLNSLQTTSLPTTTSPLLFYWKLSLCLCHLLVPEPQRVECRWKDHVYPPRLNKQEINLTFGTRSERNFPEVLKFHKKIFNTSLFVSYNGRWCWL